MSATGPRETGTREMRERRTDSGAHETGAETREADAREALLATGVTVRDAGPGDEVAGVAPRWVALPASTGEVAALLRVSAAHDLAVVPAGGRTKLHWGNPPERCDLLLDTRRLDGVPEHAAGDLVVRVQAGVTLDALATVLAGHGQELALDPLLAGATVGGTLATAVAGPRRLRYGTPRDLLIGVTVVLADGTVARSGGKVVKNVAGYDLGKLLAGSYGTLGVVTEAVFRLHPLPAARRWLTADLPALPPRDAPGGDGAGGAPVGPGGPMTPGAAASALAASQSEPSAVELDWTAPGGTFTVSALVESGSAGTAVEARARAVQDLLGGAGPCASAGQAPAWWGEAPGGGILLELRVPPAAVDHALRAVAERGLPARVRGSLDSAVLHVALPAETGPAEFAAFVSGVRGAVGPLGGRLTVLAAPPELARPVDRWGPVGTLPLMRRIKERFDPGRRLSPGRLAGGV
ncbi:FAD-binding oxidoreductase [Planomonospora corallina]|uniref:FAD-binding oxidoreductase n=1 Tax=Planomonospora corallina TaxID=1806052 RepID=A0ABV8I7W3_9ACTN